METPKITSTNQDEIICKNCAGKLKFAPGTTNLKCEFCGTENTIEVDMNALREATQEIDYVNFIHTHSQTVPMQEVVTVKCGSCGAETTFTPNVTSSECDFCGSPMVAKQGESHNVIKPKTLIPFKIDSKKSIELFNNWLKNLWWAPNALKSRAKSDKLKGIYIPYWTYDSRTNTSYSGERGVNYQEQESYTNSEGKTAQRTVTKVHWTRVNGRVNDVFDDVLVVASRSLPVKYMDRLEPWNFSQLIPYEDKFLTGFKTESYQVDVKEGFEEAKGKMDVIIEKTIKRDIGGDHQRISSKNTQYNNITFKHILLPIWISAYKYNSKTFRFMINGQTGEVQGERPYSWIKITLAILVGIIAIIVIYSLLGQ